jgi:hypothetical protein
MKPGFSEFSYGYAVTEDATRRHGHFAVAPKFPSLSEEGKKGGYDVELGTPGIPLFLQFKLSDCMVRGYADEAKRGFLSVPFYRMHLRPLSKSKQHQLLLDLETRGERVYYIAPAFHTEDEFNQAYQKRMVITRSVCIRPKNIGTLDTSEHYVSFQNSGVKFGYLFSESEGRIAIEHWEDVLNQARAILETTQPVLRSTILAIQERMIAILDRRLERRINWDEFLGLRRDENPVRTVASISQIFFDCTLFIVQSTTGTSGVGSNR